MRRDCVDKVPHVFEIPGCWRGVGGIGSCYERVCPAKGRGVGVGHGAILSGSGVLVVVLTRKLTNWQHDNVRSSSRRPE
jgi:hypothetical protein